ncbi:MAG: hypothetical protein H6983_18370 [Ectothiorhodospiraceae bacterium]|nr:hypothetical protein [Ectothiorhodospiraceae bacterium]
MHIDAMTLLLQGINFLVLVWLLQRFLYRPVLAAVDRRRREIENAREVESTARAEIATARAALEADRARLDAERARLLDDARAAARAQADRIVAETRAETERLRVEARSRLEAERVAAAEAVARKAAALGVDLAARLLAMASTDGRDRLFVGRLCATVAAMTAEDRVRLGPAEAGVRVVTADPLDPPARAHCRDALAAALADRAGAGDASAAPAPRITFDVDPSLLAGVEVHFANAVLRHSWRDALEASREALAADAARAARAPGEADAEHPR